MSPANYKGPRVDLAVDLVLYSPSEKLVLLGGKPDNSRWVFPGGFTDPSLDNCPVDTLVREAQEELNLALNRSSCMLLGCLPIPDPRYEDSANAVWSMVFGYNADSLGISALTFCGAGDDLERIRWFTRDHARANIAPHHSHLLECVSQPLNQFKPAWSWLTEVLTKGTWIWGAGAPLPARDFLPE